MQIYFNTLINVSKTLIKARETMLVQIALLISASMRVANKLYMLGKTPLIEDAFSILLYVIILLLFLKICIQMSK